MSYLVPGQVTLDEALEAAESDRWYGQSLTREIAGILAKEVRNLQDNTIPRCTFKREDQRCVLKEGHRSEHDFWDVV